MANLSRRKRKVQLSNEEKLKKEIRQNKKIFTFFIVFIILLIIFSIFVNYYFYYTPEEKPEIKGGISYYKPEPFVSTAQGTLVSMKVPAVDAEGNGVVTILSVEVMPGSGRILVDIDSLLFWADTQQSMRIARMVATNVTAADINKYDLIYNIHANASLIGGPSAGAALTIITIAALQNKSLNESVMITGTINHDGTIGPISGVMEKAKAARDVGATLFLVPLLQSRDVVYETREHCEKFGYTQICTTETVPKKVNVAEESGIQIKEIENVQEAIKYFFN